MGKYMGEWEEEFGKELECLQCILAGIFINYLLISEFQCVLICKLAQRT